MQPVLNTLTIHRESKQPVYLQIANQIMHFIRMGQMRTAAKLPGTRELAVNLSLHRKTVVRAYEELQAQGWIESTTGRGSFVAGHLPEMPASKLKSAHNVKSPKTDDNIFCMPPRSHLLREILPVTTRFHLDDGFPDARLAPLKELARAYRRQLLTGNPNIRLGYGDPKGSSWLREELAVYLNDTRGLRLKADNLMIVRGTMMGVHLVSRSFLRKGDKVLVTAMSWAGATMNFLDSGAEIIAVPIDEFGMDVQAVERICKKKKIRLLYITSHHDHPTTVALRNDRRIALLELSARHGFIILEDDYDFDFHYLSKPYLPLASSDQHGHVIYCGSFTKSISPAFRVGYLAGAAVAIDEISKARRIIDRQGDFMLENAIAELLRDGIIQRHIRKSIREYRQRRDHLCKKMTEYFPDKLQFQVPDGGMAVWTHFDKSINLNELARNAALQDTYISNGSDYRKSFPHLNAARIGFASSTIAEIDHAMNVLQHLI